MRIAYPFLAFCPYLAVSKVIEFDDWQLGPLGAFENQWGDPKFKAQSTAFLRKFVDGNGEKLEKPTLLCRRNARIDGKLPTPQEIEALEATIAFSFLDENPRHTPASKRKGWSVLTAENTELDFWPVDVEAGYVTVTSGSMVRTIGGGYRIDDGNLIIRPPIDLPTSLGGHTADAMCLDAVYKTVLQSAKSPGTNVAADRLKVAIGWFVKAWRNTATLHYAERVVFLKTAFEAITGTSKSYKSARKLRRLFEALPDTAPEHSELLVWSPSETPIHTRSWEIDGKEYTEQITDLEHWFLQFADARNQIIHQGTVPTLEYSGTNPAYQGHFVFTAEFLLRAVVKVSLASFGYPDVWRSDAWRAVKAACEEWERQHKEAT